MCQFQREYDLSLVDLEDFKNFEVQAEKCEMMDTEKILHDLNLKLEEEARLGN